VDAYAAEVATLRSQLSESAAEADFSEEKCERLRREKLTLEVTVNDLRSTVKQLERGPNESQSQMAPCQETEWHLAGAEAEITRLEDELDSTMVVAEGEVSRLESELGSAMKMARTAQQDSAAAAAEAATSQRAAENLEKERQRLLHQLQNSEAASTQLASRSVQLEADVQRLRKRLQTSRQLPAKATPEKDREHGNMRMSPSPLRPDGLAGDEVDQCAQLQKQLWDMQRRHDAAAGALKKSRRQATELQQALEEVAGERVAAQQKLRAGAVLLEEERRQGACKGATAERRLVALEKVLQKRGASPPRRSRSVAAGGR
jgi:chromosome segregation ATPase